MKKLTLLLVMFAFIANVAMAQQSEVQNAIANNRYAEQYIAESANYQRANRVEKATKAMNNAKIYLQKAKTNVDNASKHEKTMNDGKTWHYYGIVYYNISSRPEFAEIDTEALEKSFEGYSKVAQVDPKYFEMEAHSIMSSISSIADRYAIAANANVENGNYIEACNNLKKTYEIKLSIGVQDNEALLYAAQYAILAKEYNTVVELCEILVNNSYENPDVYRFMAVAQGELGNDDKMLEYLQIGREKYPDNQNIIDDQINAFIKLKREIEIIDQVKEMARLYKEKVEYNYLLGNLYSNLESPIYNIDSAVCFYDKVIEVNPNHVDTYYNKGIMYFNVASELNKQAGELGFDNESLKKYDKMVAEAKEYNEKALPLIEKSYELLPTDNVIKQALKTLYIRLKMMDKAAALDTAE